MGDTQEHHPALLRGECPDLAQVGRLLRSWLDGELAALPLDELETSWHQHRAQVEGDAGLFRVIEERAPRLEADVEVLRGQHRQLESDVAQLLGFADPAAHRDWVARLAREIEQHCAKSVNLVYDAFDQEIGGG